jgi:REP element-mobilizing transposase RayT
MKIEYHNLYTHFILITKNRASLISEQNRERIEKYITGIVNNNNSKLYSIYANPEHIHFLVSRSPKMAEEVLATIVADSSSKFINENKLCAGLFAWQDSASPSLFPNQMWTKFASTLSINRRIIKSKALQKSMMVF